MSIGLHLLPLLYKGYSQTRVLSQLRPVGHGERQKGRRHQHLQSRGAGKDKGGEGETGTLFLAAEQVG